MKWIEYEPGVTRVRRVGSGGSGGLLLFVTLALSFSIDYARAQDLPPLFDQREEDQGEHADASSRQALESRQASVAAELVALEKELGSENLSVPIDHLQAVRRRLLQIERLIKQQIELRAISVPRELTPPTAVSPSANALHALYEAKFIREEEGRRRKTVMSATRDALFDAKDRLETAERLRRRARRELEQAQGLAKRKNRRELELAKLESRVAQEEVHLSRAQARAAQEAHAADLGIAEIEERVSAMRESLARGAQAESPGPSSSVERTAELQKLRSEAAGRLDEAERDLDMATSRPSEPSRPAEAELDEIEVRQAAREVVLQEVARRDAQLDRLETGQAVWRGWDALLRGQALDGALDGLEKAASARIDELEEETRQQRDAASALESQLRAIDRRLSQIAEGSPLYRALADYRAATSRLLEVQRADIVALAADRRLAQLVLADIEDETELIDVREHADRFVKSVRDIWSYEVMVVDDSSITVGSFILALLLVLIGWWAARRGSAVLARVSKARFKLDSGPAQALQTLSFYTLLVAFTLFALRTIHFPLTAFTVLGGALAIGVGFGSQNVMNNFISGLILMLERPVGARDLVEVDGNHGTVERIGARSTQIRSVDGRHIIVPNSFFLQSNVVNWTLSDDLIRTKVSVGVIYGSPTELVEQLIRRVVAEEDQVLKVPDPIVVFEAFADNSLNFDVYFWVRARSPMAVRLVQSRVRFRIDTIFRDNGLVIAFPQRDVHLDTSSPLEVRMLADATPQRTSDK